MATDLEKLLKFLEVEQIDKYLFIGKSPKRPARVFGGQVLAQSLNAATRTLADERIAHSMHAYFLRPGNPAKQIVLEVEPIRDGRSFTTRCVVAKQDGVPIFNTTISFQTEEEGFEHQMAMPDVTGWAHLESDFDYWKRMAEAHPDKVKASEVNPIERKPVKRRDMLNPQPDEPQQHIWCRAKGDLGDNLALHQTVLAYISDFGLLGAALLPHPYMGISENIRIASLDHSIWFHRPFRADEYLLYSMDSPSSYGNRGFSRGSFYTESGVLVASTAQESLLRRVQS